MTYPGVVFRAELIRDLRFAIGATIDDQKTSKNLKILHFRFLTYPGVVFRAELVRDIRFAVGANVAKIPALSSTLFYTRFYMLVYQ